MKIIRGFKVFLLISIMAVLLFYINAEVREFLRSPYFYVKNVKIIGVSNADINKLDKFSKKIIGKNIFKIKSDVYGEKFNDSWIERIEIIRNYPSTVILNIYEKKPLFNFVKDGVVYSYLNDGSYLKARTNISNISVEGKFWQSNLNKFSSFIDSKYLKTFEKIEIYDSYILMKGKDVLYKCGFNADTFEDAMKRMDLILKRYKKVNYVDLRIDKRIYVDGVRL